MPSAKEVPTTEAGEIPSDPLHGLTSILALRSIDHMLRRFLGEGWLTGVRSRELLYLDPLTLLRCLRLVHSPFQQPAEDVLTVRGLALQLGQHNVRRVFNGPLSAEADDVALRRLWLHGLATAHAARSLAKGREDLDPEVAYVLGLLHDLPLWLHYLERHGGLESGALGVMDWVMDWHLPKTLAEVVSETVFCHDRGLTDIAGVIASAEVLAQLAGFWHPDDDDPLSHGLLHAMATQQEFAAAHDLRRTVTRNLEQFGLEGSLMAPLEEPPPTPPTETETRFPIRLGEMVLSLYNCNEWTDYKTITTASMSAALRHLSFERVHYLRWSRKESCFLRSKTDLSPRHIGPVRVTLTERERVMFGESLRSGMPFLLNWEPGQRGGLLHGLSTSQALLVPANPRFVVATFLVVDRGISGSAVHSERDSVGAQTLASITSLLTENLLLRKQSHRTQKFALTDPLTRLYNRGVGITRLAQEIARAKRTRRSLTVLMLDMDEFKTLNDTRGHLAGDMALRAAADMIRKSLRRSDTVCRYGGEEFLVILPDTSVEDASVSATRIFMAISTEGKRLDLPLTVSIGLSAVKPGEDDVEAVLSRADRALYASKERGRNRFSVDVQ